jgi:hypothetical protein
VTNAGGPICVLSFAALVVGISSSNAQVPVENPVQVNVAAGSGNIVGDAANEPTLAVDPLAPDRMVTVWRQFDDVDGSLRTAGWATSVDGGRSWTARGAVDPGVFSSDPVLAADDDGRFYLLGLEAGYQSCRLHHSDDGGMSWGPAIPALGGDKPWLGVDGQRGHVYVSWDSSFSCCGISSFARSTDAGQTFGEAIEIDPAPALGTMAVGPEGEVYVSGIVDIGTFAVARSVDARDPSAHPTFTVSEVDLGGFFAFLNDPNPEGLSGMPWVAVGQPVGPLSAPVFLLASVVPSGSDPLDVHLVRSDNGGTTWSEPTVVNASAAAGWQWFGTLDVAPVGRLDAVWYDSPYLDEPWRTRVAYAWSDDRGMTWSFPVIVAPEFNSHLGWPAERRRLGDYIHLRSDTLGADLVFAATYNGEQDIYYLRIGPRDCNRNGIPDDEDLRAGIRDCNRNDIPDSCEIASGAETDSDGDGIPDRCQPAPRRPSARRLPGSPEPAAPRAVEELER